MCGSNGAATAVPMKATTAAASPVTRIAAVVGLILVTSVCLR